MCLHVSKSCQNIKRIAPDKRMKQFVARTGSTGTSWLPRPWTDTAGRGRDVLCKARLQLHVAGPLQSIVARADSAKEAWDALQADYEGSLRTRTPQLTAQLTSLSQKGDSIVTYCDRLLHLRDQFEALKMKSFGGPFLYWRTTSFVASEIVMNTRYVRYLVETGRQRLSPTSQMLIYLSHTSTKS
jgi:hypothetical protein